MNAPRLAYVVEDDRITAVITELIAKKNLRCEAVQTFGDGQLAIEQLAAAVRAGVGVPDLILLDLNMPRMDGWEFLDAFGALPLAQQVCVLVLTSSIYPADVSKAAHYQAVKGYFPKPLNNQNVARMKSLLHEVGIYHN